MPEMEKSENKKITVLILGCGTMQVPAINIAKDMGWKVYTADADADAEGRKLADGFYHVDLKDIDGLIEAARDIRKNEGKLDGVFTAGTDFSYSVASVADAMGLPGHSPQAALNATDKTRMRKRFSEAGVSSPDYVEIIVENINGGSSSDAPGRKISTITSNGNFPGISVKQHIPAPWVVKPVDSMGARGVVRIDSTGDLEKAVLEASAYSRTSRVIVESCIKGPEYSLDALVYNGKLIRCGIADRYIEYPPYFIETGHTIPSPTLSEEREDHIWQVFEQGVKALGLTHGAAKGDVKFGPSGPVIGEIAARLSGGYMSGWTWPYASGTEPTRGALRLAVGLDPDMPETPPLNLVCAEKALIGIDGTVSFSGGAGKALEIDGVKNVFLRYSEKDKITFPKNNVQKAANVIAVGENAAEAEERAYKALQSLELVLDTADVSTGKFLEQSVSFPPDVFILSAASDNSGDADSASGNNGDKGNNSVDADGDNGAEFPRQVFFADFDLLLKKLWKDNPPEIVPGSTVSRPEIPVPSDFRVYGISIKDREGRSIYKALQKLEEDKLITLRIFPESSFSGIYADLEQKDLQMLSSFWKAFIRGGITGARWFVERGRNGAYM